MNKKVGCKMRECLLNHRREIVGGIILLLAILLTILTLSGLGIFGMFLTGLFMCCHRHMGCCCCKKSAVECCETEEVCEATSTVKSSPKKAVKTAK